MIRILTRLLRLRLSLMNGIAALGGGLLLPGPRSVATLLSACVGVSLLSMGASALNQVQERRLDALMGRTMDRPLPRGELAPATAVRIGIGMILAGCLTLMTAGGIMPVLLGLSALVWYLAVYTPLKRRTPLALPIGALCGAVPPLIGWSLAGGAPLDFRVIVLAGLLYLWQVPHFWLFQQRHAEDYRRAGIPLFQLHPGQFGLWIVALTSAALLLPLFGLSGRQPLVWFALLLPLVLSWRSCSERMRFSCLNLVPLLIVLILGLPR
jgi:protoheme IX farnesyltransferase